MDSEIKQLEEVLQLPNNSKNKSIVSCTTEPLTAAGENYGSKILSVKIVLNDGKKLNAVAKMSPPNEWIKKMFQIPITFKKEIAMYQTIFPTLIEFQRENGIEKTIDFFPKCYGARISLDPKSQEVDDDAVIILENLKDSGFVCVDRMVGFGLKTTELIVKDLAVFHAVPIALKLKKPKLFEEKIKVHLDRLCLFDAMSEEINNQMTEALLNLIKENEKCAPFIENVRKGLEIGFKTLRENKQCEVREPFATIIHCDYWVNNTMIKFVHGKPVENKMVDFQIIEYGSFARDLIFFLFSSVQKQVIDKNYDNLIDLYYRTFISTLRDLNCDATPFSYSLFEKELEIEAINSQFSHIIGMCKPIFALKGKIKDLSEFTEADMMSEDTLSDRYVQKVHETVLEFAERKWI